MVAALYALYGMLLVGRVQDLNQASLLPVGSAGDKSQDLLHKRSQLVYMRPL